MAAQDSLDRLRASATKKKRFFTTMAFYEEGEKTGRLLARISRSQQSSPIIGAIRSPMGRVLTDPDQIVILAAFYSDLYGSRDDYRPESLAVYLDGVALPTLSPAACPALDALLTLKELQVAASSFPTFRSGRVYAPNIYSHQS